jgi:hypothetical protein
MTFSPEEFGSAFKGFLQSMSQKAPAEEPPLRRRLMNHFGGDPSALPVVREAFPRHELANVHLALDDCLARPGRSAALLGVHSPHTYSALTLAELVAPGDPSLWGGGRGPTEGPVQFDNVALEGDRVLACVRRGLFLVRAGDDRLAALVEMEEGFRRSGVLVEVMAARREAAEGLLAELRVALRQRNVYRGRVVSLAEDEQGGLEVKFHALPPVERDGIVLAPGVLERIERQTVGFARHAERLKAGGRHLKRGLLLHGPPGTGKTLTAMYLAGAMPGRTVLLLKGRGLGLVQQTCALARTLQPSTVVLEDVDLIAEERTQSNGCATPLLFELLNEMDGLAEDADVVFLLTTNRPELLEPALAARPGRIDLAVAVPPPDPACRRRLFELYARGLEVAVADWQPLVARTEGASAAFIRELLRRAALFAADDAAPVGERHLDEALHELVVQGGALTRSLLGFRAGERRG